MVKNIVEISNLSIGYKRGRRSTCIQQGINLTAKKGEMIMLVGQNGVGKSTLIKTILNIIPPISGRITMAGQRPEEISPTMLAQLISFVSPQVVAEKFVSVFDLVAIGRNPHTNWFGHLTAADTQRIDEAIRMVGLTKYRNTFITDISDGEKQRAMIARALAQDSDIIILDEPTAFLDLAHRYEITALLHRLAKQQGRTIILSTHDLNIALREADKLWLMLPGEVCEGAPEDLILRQKVEALFDMTANAASGALFFDSLSGDFRLRRQWVAQVALVPPLCKPHKGSRLVEKWTTSALNRAGFAIDKAAPVSVSWSGDSQTVWHVSSRSDTHNANSLYELIDIVSRGL